MDMPDEIVLIARGRYTTLSGERKKQLERYRKTTETAMHALQQALKDISEMPPSSDAIWTAEKCVQNLKASKGVIDALCNQMIELKPMAWSE